MLRLSPDPLDNGMVVKNVSLSGKEDFEKREKTLREKRMLKQSRQPVFFDKRRADLAQYRCRSGD